LSTKVRAFVALTLIAGLIGCAVPTQRTVTITAPWDEAAADKLLQPGANTIKGNGFMRQRGGGVVTCAGEDARLIPGTAYAAERIRVLYGSTESGHNSGHRSPAFDPSPTTYTTKIRTTRCDSQGNFTFEGVADGSFFVQVSVRWMAGDSPQGGNLMHRVQLTGGKSVSVVLAK